MELRCFSSVFGTCLASGDLVARAVYVHITSANIFGHNLGVLGKHAEETASIFSGNFNGSFQTHFWQNSNIRNKVFQKQHAGTCHMHLEGRRNAW